MRQDFGLSDLAVETEVNRHFARAEADAALLKRLVDVLLAGVESVKAEATSEAQLRGCGPPLRGT